MSKYDVIFSGLSVGKHNLDFDIDDRFFDHFDYSEIKRGNLLVKIELNRMAEQIAAKFVITGFVTVVCDRCLDDVNVNIEYEDILLIKYVRQENEDNTEVMYLNHGDDTINFAQYIYESICMSLPVQRIHASESQCDAEMIKRLKEMVIN